MKRIVKIVAVVLLAGFAAIQFVQVDKTNPPINESETLEAAVPVPPDVSLILGRSCNDCHSHKTRYPWYSYVQPAGWFLRDHVDHGRSHLNFSVFNTYSESKKKKKLEEICEMVESGSMPLASYLWIHRDAILAPTEGRALCEWTKSLEPRLAS